MLTKLTFFYYNQINMHKMYGVIIMKEWVKNNYFILLMLLGFLLYWLFGVIITYITVLSTIVFVIYAKGTNRVQMYNFDLVLFVSYLLLSIFGLFITKNATVQVLSIILGILFIASFYRNKRINKL